MFYYPNVLQRHTGCFSTVWLAATKGTKIAKREYLKVNVIKTCKKIMQYILHQVPPPYHGSPIPRLSLYLSAQLSYGTVCVFHRQCDLLIEEMKITLDRLHKAETQLKIDLLQPDLSLLLPDSLLLMQMSENAPDPFFGIMDVLPELPDPMGIPQIRVLLETSGPDIVRFEETPPKRRRRSPRDESDHLASPEAITMREEEPILLPSAEIGPDIPELSEFDLDFLVSELPAFPEAETLPGSPKREVPRERKGQPKDRGQPKAPRERPMEPQEGEHLAEEEVHKVDEEGILELEKEGEEESRSEIERKRTELKQLERDIKLLREEQRLLELQRKSEREQERREKEERESQLLQTIQREAEALDKAKKELERLQSTEAAGELLLEKERKIEQLKELQKERELQLEAENVRQLQREAERELERLQERQRDREQLQEAKEAIEQLRRSLAEKEEEWKRTEESRRISEISEPDISSISEVYKPSPVDFVSEPDFPMQPVEVIGEPAALPPEGAPETPTPQLVSPQPPSLQLLPPELPLVSDDRPVRRRGRRIKLFIDQEIQIESRLLRKQISDPHICTQPMHPVTLPHLRPRTPASLLDSPTYEHFIAPELRELWSRCAVLEPMQYMQEREEDTMSEVVRAVSESGVSMILSSELSLEVSEEERSKPIVFTPVEGRSIQEDKFLPIVTEMPELSMEMPETQDILVEDVKRNLYSHIDSEGQSEFLSLTPHSFSRLLVSRFFFSCLELHTEDIIHMAQVEPYGQIVITPGARYASI